MCARVCECRFGSGFTVKMYLAGASCDSEAITTFMQRRFPSTYLKVSSSQERMLDRRKINECWLLPNITVLFLLLCL